MVAFILFLVAEVYHVDIPTDLKYRDSQVQPFMPKRESSENSLTSRHLSDKLDGMKLRSDSVANGDILSELDTISRTSLHPHLQGTGFTDSLVKRANQGELSDIIVATHCP
ncbi:MAG: hypothetical protein RLZZ419_739 [Pseudomonadota bacterium]|jgi:hypothetical protein